MELLELVAYIITFMFHLVFDIIVGISNLISETGKEKQEIKAA